MTPQEIIEWVKDDIKNAHSGRQTSARLHSIYEHGIVEETLLSMKRELSDNSYAKAKERVPDINLIKKITDRLSRVYNKPAVRKTTNATNQELIDYYRDALNLDQKMQTANLVLELCRGGAIEPYMSEEGPRIRVLTNYQCMAHGFDETDPTRVTAATKFLKSSRVEVARPHRMQMEWAERYLTYTKDLQITWNTRTGITDIQANDLGKIPLIWLNPSEFELNPFPPESDISSPVLVPKLYADLYYAVQYATHSMAVLTDGDLPPDAKYAPDSVLIIESLDDKTAKFQFVKPEADVKGILGLIGSTVKDLLETKGLKVGNSNNVERPNATASMIEQADASAHIIKRCSLFMRVENELWDLLAEMHNNFWRFDERVTLKKTFNTPFDIEVIYSEVRPAEVRMELLLRLEKQIQMGLMTKLGALEELYPHLTQQQLNQILDKVEDEGLVNAISSASTVIPERQPAAIGGAADNTEDTEQDD